MIEKLAYTLGKNNESPNIELAELLYKTRNISGIDEIASALKEKNNNIVNDCIKVLYEIGQRDPSLISKYANIFISCLTSKNNRLVWGCMTALAMIAELVPNIIFEHLSIIKNTYENGSVITIDNSISVFAKLCKSNNKYSEVVFPIIINHLLNCRTKEIPQHAERVMICINSENAQEFIHTLEKRMNEFSPTQKTRIDKILKKFI